MYDSDSIARFEYSLGFINQLGLTLKQLNLECISSQLIIYFQFSLLVIYEDN